jgi:endonuclease YncB( thermonuclease family)
MGWGRTLAVCAAAAVALATVVVGEVDAAQRARRAHAVRTQPACPRAGTAPIAVARVADGDTVVARDGREIDLAGILAPGSGGERATPSTMHSARDALTGALSSGPVMIAVMGEPDRYGRAKAQVFAGSEWVQARLVSRGLARAAPDIASASCMPALLAIEKRAREARAGHWGDGAFAVRAPDDLRRVTGTFQIIEGQVQTAAVVRGRVYLNFGANWRTDFTATAAPGDKRSLRARPDWKALQGKRIRVRGWMEFYNGPMIALYAPGQIEFIDTMPKPPRKPRKPRKPRAPKPAAAKP